MLVWSPDHNLQLVNGRFSSRSAGCPRGSIGPGMAVREVIDISVRHGLHPDEKTGGRV